MIENPMVSTSERRYHFERMIPVRLDLCGCGRKAAYLVYDHEEPHCMSCFSEAVDGTTGILVRSFPL